MGTLIIFVLLFISFIGTYITMRVAIRKNIMDIPNKRSSHTIPTPRAGGIAVVVTWYAGLVFLLYQGIIEKSLFFALACGLILALISFLDDIYTLKPIFRILIHFISITMGLYFIGGLRIVYINDSVMLVPWFMNLVVVLGAVWFVNLYNFIDGIDAYASMEAILVALGMYLIFNNPVFILLICAVAGFLFWNLPKAKIFLGDVGSTQLGYILIILGIYCNNLKEINIIGWLIITSLFWFDATITLYRRWRNHENLTVAHRNHAYQRIVKSGFSHQKTVIYATIVNLFFIGLLWLSEMNYLPYLVAFFGAILLNSLILYKIDKREHFLQ